VSAQADRLEIEDVPITPGKPSGTWQRLRVRDQVRTLHSRGVISDAVWWAVCRWRDDAEIAMGISDAEPGMRSPTTGLPQPYSDAMLDASTRVAGGWKAVAPDTLIVRWCVTLQGTLREFEVDQRMRHGSATPTLCAALDRLCNFYNSLA